LRAGRPGGGRNPLFTDTQHGSEAAHAPAHGERGHAQGETGTAHESLPLRPIMQQLAGDMAGFTYAMWLQEYDVMAEHAASMASHTPLSPEEIQRIETELGPDMHL